MFDCSIQSWNLNHTLQLNSTSLILRLSQKCFHYTRCFTQQLSHQLVRKNQFSLMILKLIFTSKSKLKFANFPPETTSKATAEVRTLKSPDCDNCRNSSRVWDHYSVLPGPTVYMRQRFSFSSENWAVDEVYRWKSAKIFFHCEIIWRFLNNFCFCSNVAQQNWSIESFETLLRLTTYPSIHKPNLFNYVNHYTNWFMLHRHNV